MTTRKVTLSKDGVSFEAFEDFDTLDEDNLLYLSEDLEGYCGESSNWRSVGWEVTPVEPTLREKIEALPVGTRFLVYSPDKSAALKFRTVKGVGNLITDPGNWAWWFVQSDLKYEIEVLPPKGETL